MDIDAFQERENARETISEQVMRGGHIYDVQLKPYDFWISYGRAADGYIDAGSPVTGLDSGSPSVTVSRNDGTKMTRTGEAVAREVAVMRCEAHPKFRRDKVFGEAMALDDGVWKFMEVCK